MERLLKCNNESGSKFVSFCSAIIDLVSRTIPLIVFIQFLDAITVNELSPVVYTGNCEHYLLLQTDITTYLCCISLFKNKGVCISNSLLIYYSNVLKNVVVNLQENAGTR